MSLRFRLALSTACAVLAALLFIVYAGHVRAEADSVREEAAARFGGDVVSLVVATKNLKAGDEVSKANVRERGWVSSLAPEGAITSLEVVMGSKVAIPVAKNAPLTKTSFEDPSPMVQVPSGYVAVSIPASERVGVTSGVPTGASLTAYQLGDSGAKVIARGLRVLSSTQEGSLGMDSRELTLAVRPEDVEWVLSASTRGDLRLVLPSEDIAAGKAGEVDSAPEQREQGEGGDAADSKASAGGLSGQGGEGR